MTKMMRITCSGCYRKRKLTQKKFPLLLIKRVPIKDADGTIKGMSNQSNGFLCDKCAHKQTIQKEIKKDEDLQGLGWRKAIKQFLKKSKQKLAVK